MKFSVIYRPQSEWASSVEAFVRDIERQEHVVFELIDVDSPAAMDIMRLYDIMDHPTIVITRDDGQLIRMWSGSRLPLIPEVAAFARG